MAFLEEHYGTFVISALKKQYLQRDLKELQWSSLDLVYYSQLIKQVRETGQITPVNNSSLLLAELLALFRKNGFGN